MTQPHAVSEFQIGRMMMGLWVPQVIHAAAELGLADALAHGPSSASQIAAALGTHPEATHRLLDALVVLELVARVPSGYALTELGGFLRSDVSTSRRAWARLMGGERVWRAWVKLTECVRTGEAAYSVSEKRASETETFDALVGDPDAADVFHRAMADGTRSVACEIVSAIEFGDVKTVVDVGGGYGELLCAALDAHAHVRGEVFDLEHARAGAMRCFAERGQSSRAAFVAGDLFRESPPAADLLLMKSVIHDWGDARSVEILERCRHAIRSRGRLVIVEPTAPEPDAPVSTSFAWVVAFSDLNMLVSTGGRERTAAAYSRLITRAGLRLREVKPCGFYTGFVCDVEP